MMPRVSAMQASEYMHCMRCCDLMQVCRPHQVCLLQGLKQQLRALEWLMERHFPALAAHLQVDTIHVVLCYPPRWSEAKSIPILAFFA